MGGSTKKNPKENWKWIVIWTTLHIKRRAEAYKKLQSIMHQIPAQRKYYDAYDAGPPHISIRLLGAQINQAKKIIRKHGFRNFEVKDFDEYPFFTEMASKAYQTLAAVFPEQQPTTSQFTIYLHYLLEGMLLKYFEEIAMLQYALGQRWAKIVQDWPS